MALRFRLVLVSGTPFGVLVSILLQFDKPVGNKAKVKDKPRDPWLYSPKSRRQRCAELKRLSPVPLCLSTHGLKACSLQGR